VFIFCKNDCKILSYNLFFLREEKNERKVRVNEQRKEIYLRPSEVDGSPNGVSVEFVRVLVRASNSSLQSFVLLGTVDTNGSCNRLSKILFERDVDGDFGFGEEDLRKVGDGGESEEF
jgi:hypothetical protein